MKEEVKTGKGIVFIAEAILLSCNLLAYFRNGGMSIFNDTPTYIAMSEGREPLYPTILWLLRSIFGVDNYFLVLFILQTLFSIVATYYFVCYLKRRFALSNISVVMLYLGLFFYFQLPCAFIIKWGAPWACMVLTEGISYSLFLFWIIAVFDVLLGDKGAKKWIILSLVSALIFLTRNSLGYIWVVDFLCVFYRYYRKNKACKKCAGDIVVPIAIFLCSIMVMLLLECTYFFVTTGRFMRRTDGNKSLLVNVIRLADEDDFTVGVGDNETAEIFRTVYLRLKEEDCLVDSSESFVSRSKSIETNWEDTLYKIYQPTINEYAHSCGIYDSVEISIFGDRVAKDMCSILFKRHIGQWIKSYFSMWYNGYKRTVCPIAPPIILMDIYTIIVFIISVGIVLARRKDAIMQDIAFVGFFSILGLISSASIIIYCMSRYVLYNIILAYLPIVTFLDRSYHSKKGLIKE